MHTTVQRRADDGVKVDVPARQILTFAQTYPFSNATNLQNLAYTRRVREHRQLAQL